MENGGIPPHNAPGFSNVECGHASPGRCALRVHSTGTALPIALCGRTHPGATCVDKAPERFAPCVVTDTEAGRVGNATDSEWQRLDSLHAGMMPGQVGNGALGASTGAGETDKQAQEPGVFLGGKEERQENETHSLLLY